MTRVWMWPIMVRRWGWKETDHFLRWVCTSSHSNSLLIHDGQCKDAQELLSPQWTCSLGWCRGTWLKEELRVGWLRVGRKKTQKHKNTGQGNWGKRLLWFEMGTLLEFIYCTWIYSIRRRRPGRILALEIGITLRKTLQRANSLCSHRWPWMFSFLPSSLEW